MDEALVRPLLNDPIFVFSDSLSGDITCADRSQHYVLVQARSLKMLHPLLGNGSLPPNKDNDHEMQK